jgi:hypothetical protein
MRRILAILLLALAFFSGLHAQTTPPQNKRGEIADKKAIVDNEKNVETYTIICPVVKDTWIYAFRPDSNYGNGMGWKDQTDPVKDITVPKIFLGFGGSDKKVVLLQFDLSKLPKDKEAKKAVVKLYNDFAGSDAVTKVDAKMITGPWEEMKVTWKSKPKWTSSVVATTSLKGAINYGQQGKWYEWDVTKLIHVWIINKKPNHGVVLEPAGDSGVDRDFICKEYKGKEQFYPMLEVTYAKKKTVTKPVKKD